MQSSQGKWTEYETIELFRESVETARLGIQQSLAGSEKVGEAVKPKLTIDLSHRELQLMPEDVAEMMKTDVERYGSSRLFL